jgi:predicted DNA-binding transcriptional regulator YafY
MLNVTFTQDELNALAALLDTAVKATGIQGARAALPLIDKLEKAVAAANAPQPQEQEGSDV